MATIGNKTISNLSELPEEVMQEIRDLWEESPDFKFEDIEGLQEGIREGGNSAKTVDYSYIYRTYTLTTANFQLIAVGASYLKDQSVCDEQWEEGVEIIDLREEIKRREEKAHFAIVESDKQWEKFVDNIDFIEAGTEIEDVNKKKLLEALQQFQFPKSKISR